MPGKSSFAALMVVLLLVSGHNALATQSTPDSSERIAAKKKLRDGRFLP